MVVKLGIYTINTDNKKAMKYNQNYHFLISTVFKFLLVGAVLDYDMHNQGFLEKKILISKNDIGTFGYAPITAKNMKSLAISQLNYAVILSDNPAANILVRELGDNETIIAANEPEVNYIPR